MSKWCVVVPTVRPKEFSKFKRAWSDLFNKHDVELIVIDDMEKPFDKSHLSWKDIPDFIPRKTDMIRSFGFYKAWKTDCDYVLTLDDDVRPTPGVDIFEEYEKEFEGRRPLSKYLSVGSFTTSGLEMRGFPYEERSNGKVIVQYGGWNGVLDYDAATQLANPRGEEFFYPVNVPVPVGAAATCCIMNCAFRKEFVHTMWQLPLLDGRYNRTGDIWSGLFQKKVLDYLGGVMLINGRASVMHERASNKYKSLSLEAPSLQINEGLWGALKEGDFETVTNSAYEHFKKFDQEYAEKFINSRDQWLDLLNEV